MASRRALACLPRASFCSLSCHSSTFSKSQANRLLTRAKTTLSNEPNTIDTKPTAGTSAHEGDTNTASETPDSRMDEIFRKIQKGKDTWRRPEPIPLDTSLEKKRLVNEARVVPEELEEVEVDANEESWLSEEDVVGTAGANSLEAEVDAKFRFEEVVEEKEIGETKEPIIPPPGLELPPSPTTKKTPWLSSQEFKTYLEPLYQYGWILNFQKNIQHDVVSHNLESRKFVFPTWDQGREFMNAIDKIAQAENHHPNTMTLSAGRRSIWVEISLNTHSAKRPVWVQKPDADRRVIPGVTTRDFRFAVLVERLYRSQFDGGAPTVLPPRNKQPSFPVIHKLCNIAPRKLDGYCSACGGHHSGEECPPTTGKTLLPLCYKCRQRHAPMSICPKTRKAFMAKAKTPCPNCQGNHWLVDCRKPMLPRSEAESLMIPMASEITLEK